MAIEYAIGSNDATTSDAMSIRRGVLGAIIAKIRISRQIHEIRKMLVAGGGTAQALNAAIPATVHQHHRDAGVALALDAVLALRRCQYITAEPATPHS